MTTFYFYVILTQFFLSFIIFVSLLFITAPYGRHAKKDTSSKLMLSPTLGWIIMEGPAFATILLASLILFFRQSHSISNNLLWAPFVFVALWEFHYIYRFFIYPFLLHRKTHSMPLGIAISGAFFNIINGLINAWWLMKVKTYSLAEFWSPHFIIGCSLFFIGFFVHVYSDHRLRKATKERQDQYIIPMCFPHTIVCSPNYLGEIIQWTGWAVATWSLAGGTFAVFTMANLIPRALKHLHWYHQKFPDYPKKRRAIIPFVL